MRKGNAPSRSGFSQRLNPLAAFRQGLISDLGNPKIAVFFASLLPQFVPAGAATFSAFLLLGIVFALMTFAWLTLYASRSPRLAISCAGRGSPAIEAFTGTLLIGLGIRIAAEQR